MERIQLKYDIKQRIGVGKFGKVYLIKNKINQDVFALKLIDYDKMKVKYKEQIYIEIKILQKNYDPNIIKYYSHFDDIKYKKMYIIMDLYKMDLFEFIQITIKKKERFTIKFIWNTLFNLVKALYQCHKNDIIHLDIKPENILISKNHEAKLGDFGLSCINISTYLYVGTLEYMSPEMLEHKKYSVQTDIWSLGCVLYELCTLSNTKYQKGQIIILNDYYKSFVFLITQMLIIDPNKRITIYQLFNIINNSILV